VYFVLVGLFERSELVAAEEVINNRNSSMSSSNK